jgi:hypothetical protein
MRTWRRFSPASARVWDTCSPAAKWAGRRARIWLIAVVVSLSDLINFGYGMAERAIRSYFDRQALAAVRVPYARGI